MKLCAASRIVLETGWFAYQLALKACLDRPVVRLVITPQAICRKTRPDGTPIRRMRTVNEMAARGYISYQYSNSWHHLCRRAETSEKINPYIVRHACICRLFEKAYLRGSQIAMLAGDVNMLLPELCKHVLVERLRDHYDVRQDPIRDTPEGMIVKKQENLAELPEHWTSVHGNAQEEHEQNGDFPVPRTSCMQP